MKKLLMFFMALLTLAAATPAAHAKRSIMELPPFERAILIIKKFETLHRPCHWPTIGYGHVVQRGERFTRRQLSEREADALLRKDYMKFCNLYKAFGADMYLLGALAYNVGPAKVNSSTLIKKLRAGNRDIIKDYTKFCRYKGKFHKQLHQRRLTEIFVLFRP